MSASKDGEGFVEMVLKGAAFALGAGVITMIGRRLSRDDGQIIVVVDRESLCEAEEVDEVADAEAQP